MNDLERDLREVLHEDARHVATPASAPEGLRRSARRRQVVFVGLVGLAGAAVVAGIVAGATTLLPLQRGPEPAPGAGTIRRVEPPRPSDAPAGPTAPRPPPSS